MNAPKLVIIDGVRTPFCKMGSELARVGADELGRIASQALLTRTGVNPAIIDEVIFGCVGQPAEVANVSRVIALRAGIPEHVPAITVHRNCASGMEAFTQAYEKMCAGRGEVFLVGGTENMSKYPLQYSDAAAAKFARLGRAKTLGQRIGASHSCRASPTRSARSTWARRPRSWRVSRRSAATSRTPLPSSRTPAPWRHATNWPRRSARSIRR